MPDAESRPALSRGDIAAVGDGLRTPVEALLECAPMPDARTAERTEGLTRIVLECANNPEFLAEFNRLTGCSLGAPRSTIEQMIDESTGWEQEQLRRFVAFVMEFVVLPLATAHHARCSECPHGGQETCPCGQPTATFDTGHHTVRLRFCSEVCALAHPASPDDLDALRERLTGSNDADSRPVNDD